MSLEKLPKFSVKKQNRRMLSICGSAGKESACNAGDLGLIPGWGRTPGAEMAIHSNIFAWEIPWTEKTGRL